MKTALSFWKISLALGLSVLTLCGQTTNPVKRISEYLPITSLGSNDDFIVNQYIGGTNYATKRANYWTVAGSMQAQLTTTIDNRVNNLGALLYDGTGTSSAPVTAWPQTLKTVQAKGASFATTNWGTIVSNNGSGVIKKIWLAVAANVGPTNLYLRLRVDGATFPQIGGTNGLTVPVFFGNDAVQFAGARRGAPRRLNNEYAGYHTLETPYSQSWSLEMFIPPGSEGSSGNQLWYTIWMEDGGTFRGGPGWRLYANQVRTNYAANGDYKCFDAGGNVWLAGILQRIQGTNTDVHLEDNHYFALNGESAAASSVKTSGTEDLTGMAWFFAIGETHNDRFDVFAHAGNYASFAYWWHMDMDGPSATNGLALYMHHAYAPTTTTNETTVWYYTK